MDRVETAWCVDCGGRFTDEEILSRFCCPGCGSEGVPCSAEQDLLVEINWHELRVLGIWAENWARHCAERPNGGERMPATVTAICRRLQRQFPDLAPLTLAEEIAALPSELAKQGIEVGNVETNVDKPKPIVVKGNGAIGNAKRRPA